jgi:hypothetical protein
MSKSRTFFPGLSKNVCASSTVIAAAFFGQPVRNAAAASAKTTAT